MKRAAVAIVWFACAVAGCATLGSGRGPGAEDQLARGLAALAGQDFASARPLLERLYLEHGPQPAGRQALLALAAAELDPRNPERRLAVGAELTGRYLSLPAVPAWTVPAAGSLYRLAAELDSVPARIQRLAAEHERERGELRLRLGALEQRLAATEKELRDAQAELERIRRTLKR